MSIRLKIFLIIISIVLVITVSSVGLGIFFAQNQIIKTIQNDMLLVASLADELVSREIDLLKARTLVSAHRLFNAPQNELPRILGEEIDSNDTFMALTIINSTGVVEGAYGVAPTPSSLVGNEYMQRAFAGEMVISSTYQDASGDLVFHVYVPMGEPGPSGAYSLVLSATIPGMHFSKLVSRFRVWESGHITIDDKDGTVIANTREEWVMARQNFLLLAKASSQYEGIARIVKRMISGETGIGSYSIGGIMRVSAFMPISGSKVGWSLGVVAPLAESPFYRVRRILLAAGSAFLGLGFLAAFLASGSIAQPFEQIRTQNIQLAELNEKAQSASKAKSAFLANMSHEMRTPLNAIIGLSELSLSKGGVPQPVQKNLEKVYGSGMTLLGIVNDLLDISKIESGKFEIIASEYDLPSLINDTVNLNIVRIGSKPITFNLLIDETLPAKLIGDELRLKQVFNNLLSNAFKYTREGTVDLRITTESEGETVWLTASVRDTGIGIKAEDMGKLFTDYNRLDTQKNRSLEGTGLGLALAKKMVTLMDGVITVESEYGKGSAFTVRVKQKYVSSQTIGAQMAENLIHFQYADQKRGQHAELPRIQLPRARVLVVDDVDINLDVAQGMMEPYGMKIDCVLGGAKAVELVRKAEIRYDAIFMDHMMPGMDGIEAVRIIREEIGTSYAKNIPIIALTANAIAGNEAIFLGSGFQDFLSKPMDILRLDEVIRRWIRNKDREKDGTADGHG